MLHGGLTARGSVRDRNSGDGARAPSPAAKGIIVPMKWSILLSTILISSLPLAAVAATPPDSQNTGSSSQVKFTILPGPLTPGKPYKTSFDYALRPGQTRSYTLSIVNASHTEPLTVKLRVAEVTTRPVGGGAAFNTSSHQRQLGLWVRPSATTVTVAPYTISNVPVVVSVPAGAAPGQYAGAFDALDARSQTVQQGKSKLHLFVNIRRIITLQVLGTTRVGLAVVSAGTERSKGHLLLDLRVRNSGTVIDRPLPTTLTLTRGSKVYTLRPTLGVLMGGDSTVAQAPLDGVVPAGAYNVRAQLTFMAATSPNSALRTFTTVWTGRLTVPAGT